MKTRAELEEEIAILGHNLAEIRRLFAERIESELEKENRTLQETNRQLLAEIAERDGADNKIERAAREWRTTFDAITDMVSIQDRGFRLTRLNRAFADFFGYAPAELIGKSCCQLVHNRPDPIPGCPHLLTLQTGKPQTSEFYEPRMEADIEVTTSPIFGEEGTVTASVHVIRDVTVRKRMAQRLMIADRLASIGELASGIAHELNNPLTSIIGFSQLLLDRDIPPEITADLHIISSEAQRAAGVVKNLLTFARKHAPQKQLLDVHEVINNVLELRRYEQKVNNIRVKSRLADNLPFIMADYFQLQQVVLNIIINAEHFMLEAHNKGTLTVSTRRQNDTVEIAFTDDGPGIPKENLKHLFDPFFTTKEVGKGTGLGLSICHGIITGHGGEIIADGEPGPGATFTIRLPIGERAGD